MSDSADHSKSCPKCGAMLSAEATDGLCPNCLMNEALQPTQVSDASKPRHAAILAPEALAPFFPQYEILRMLGRGGMGAVYLARQISLNRLVAIKVLPSDMGESELGFAERFKNEAQAMAQLSHPSIVAVYDFGQTTNGLLYIVMEYIEGTDVQLMLTSQGRLHSAHAMAITAHVCDALAYAHSRGIIHRDIKPSNIMVSNEGVVKVADFGLAKMSHAQTTGLTQSGMAMGTPHFMAPEALTLGSAVDQRADIYAVGVMLYQMLTGKLPQGMFEMPSFQVPGLDPRYDRIVAKALRDDREQRYQVAGELRHDLDAILTQPVEKVAPEAAEVKALPPVEQRGKKKARVPSLPSPQAASPALARKKPVGLVFTILCVVVAVAAAFVYFRDHGARPITKELALATKDQPFVNSLGMKFVPVPITGGPTDGKRILFSIWETRVQDYELFAKETGRELLMADFPQELTHPVTKVSRDDARSFCEWLTERERKAGRIGGAERYRLPSDHEWSCAVEIGGRESPGKLPNEKNKKIADVFPWTGNWPPPAGAGNFPGEELQPALTAGKYVGGSYGVISGYRDAFVETSPVGSFQANNLGLQDLSGNVWEWCEDWYDSQLKDGMLRGGSWLDPARSAFLSSNRYHGPPGAQNKNNGFRCVLDTASQDVSPSPSFPAFPSSITATKDAPFVNTLGMKFVPVPIGCGPTKGERVLFSIWDTRVQDYLEFARANKVDGGWQTQQKDGVPAGREMDHPVVGVNWDDAKAFCQWLTAKEIAEGKLPAGMKYRLPSDEEWSWAVGLPPEPGATPAEKSGKNGADFPWGTASLFTGKAANYVDDAFHAKFSKQKAGNGEAQKHPEAKDWFVGYDDGYATTSPVGIFPANAFGLYDMGGNVWQWCEDWLDKDQKERVLRGGSWGCGGRLTLLSSYRKNCEPGMRGFDNGFRCVLAPDISPSPAPASATKDAPFVNTLGMKFVPVPISGPARSASLSDAGGGATNGRRVLFSVWETRVQDYALFAKETKREWPRPSFEQGPTHPAVMVSWDDAQAFCVWLTERERKTDRLGVNERYRLPSDHEWSCAAGIGSLEEASMSPAAKNGVVSDIYPWGRAWPPPQSSGNYAGEERQTVTNATNHLEGHRDAFVGTAPVGSFLPNEHGLFDLGGNAWEWCEDSIPPDDQYRVIRGSAWDGWEQNKLKSSLRAGNKRNIGYANNGFRIVLETSMSAEASAPAPSSFVSLPLGEIAPHPVDGFSQPLVGSRTFNGVPFEFANPPKYFITQNQYQPQSPVSAALKVDVPGAAEVFLMMCGKGGGTPELEGKKIGNVTFAFSDGSSFVAPLKMETHLRRASWLSDYTNPVKPPGDDVVQVSEAIVEPQFRGRPAKGYMDMLTIKLPPEKSGLTLTGITFNDTSAQTVKSIGPGFDVYAVTVKRAMPSTITATKDAPFVNSLGMKFVPVPGTRILMCVHETRRKDYATYAAGSPGADGSWKDENAGGFTPTGNMEDHPVMKVSWEDAQKFCAWLSQKEGKTYRLPTDQEWSMAVGIGQNEKLQQDTTPATVFKNQTDFPWGTQWPPPKDSGNFCDLTRKAKVPDSTPYYLHDYEDGFPTTAPVMSFKPNEIGLYDLSGNVCEWCADWYDTTQKERVLRGGSWNDNDRTYLLSSYRGHSVPDTHNGPHGFRVVLVPPVSPAATEAPRLKASSSPTSASKESPFTNTLAMKFVPVPNTDVLFCIHETRRQDYASFAEVIHDVNRAWMEQQENGVACGAERDHPVVGVSWHEAGRFCEWLSQKEGRRYRLPTDREWSWAVGIGQQEASSPNSTPELLNAKLANIFPWGGDYPPVAKDAGNYTDSTWHEHFPAKPWIENFSDGYPTTAPVMSFKPNNLGLYDLGGNVWEFVQDWWNPQQQGRVLRGGSFNNIHQGMLLSSGRFRCHPTDRFNNHGFRIVLEP